MLFGYYSIEKANIIINDYTLYSVASGNQEYVSSISGLIHVKKGDVIKYNSGYYIKPDFMGENVTFIPAIATKTL